MEETVERLAPLYAEPPLQETTVDEFSTSAVDRLHALAQNRNGGHQDFCDLREVDQRRLDEVSHFALRLAFCREEDWDAWSWWVALEAKLFEDRFCRLPCTDQVAWLRKHSPEIRPATEVQSAAACSLAEVEVGAVEQYVGAAMLAVPWATAPRLVSSRAVLLVKGTALVLPPQMPHLAAELFRARLMASRGITARVHAMQLEGMSEQDRLGESLRIMLQGAHSLSQLRAAPRLAPGTLRLPQLFAASALFPLCAHQVLGGLRRHGHLKFHARKQLALYLKGVGLPLSDARQLVQEHFRKHPDPQVTAEGYTKKKKSYGASMAGLYGQGSTGKDYSPYSCDGLLKLPPGFHACQCHGCPYQRYDEHRLRTVLPGIGVPVADIEEVVALAVHKAQPQAACTRAFEAARGISYPQSTVSAPHEYYIHSRRDQG